jgi:hypothetical protein
MRRNGVIRQVTLAMHHQLMQVIAASKNPFAMLAVGIAGVFRGITKITKHHTAKALSVAP